jgi:hypothetical protein
VAGWLGRLLVITGCHLLCTAFGGRGGAALEKVYPAVVYRCWLVLAGSLQSRTTR